MASPETRELRNLLNSLVSQGSPSAPSGSTPEAHTIDLLVGTMSGYECGDYDTQEVVQIFKDNPIPGFDVLSWIQSKVDEGVYDWPTEVD